MNLYTLFLQCTPPLPTQATNGGELPPWPEPIPTECTTGIVLQSFEAHSNDMTTLIFAVIALIVVVMLFSLVIKVRKKKMPTSQNVIWRLRQ